MTDKGDLSELDKKVLDILQQAFPLVPSPYKAIGSMIGIPGGKIITCIQNLKSRNIIRQISAIYNTDKMGFSGTLAAFKVDPGSLEKTAALINSHPGVSHNYRRDDGYNLWFTIACPADCDLEKQVTSLAARTGVKDLLILPKIKAYKRKVIFRVSANKSTIPAITFRAGRNTPEEKLKKLLESPVKREVMKELQEDLPVCPSPFGKIAERYDLDTETLLAFLYELIREQRVSRFAAIIRNNRIGFTKNAMVVWKIAESDTHTFCTAAAAYELVSHCYTRRSCPAWPYNVYTMIHGTSEEQNNSIITSLQDTFGPREHRILYSTHEYKKQRINYFTDSYRDWE